MKTFEEYHARLEAFCRRPYSPDEAAELLHELESYVAANKHDLTLVAKPKTGLQRAAWRLQGHDARHRARQRQAIHTLFDVPVSQADEFLEALQSVASHATESHPERSRLDVARALAGYPPAGQPFERPSATRALSMIRRLTRTEARRIVDEIFRRADLFGDDPPGPLVILKQALTVGYMEAGFLARRFVHVRSYIGVKYAGSLQ